MKGSFGKLLDGKGRFYISRPETDHGGLKTAWQVGNIHVGAEVRLILVRQRGDVPLGEPGRRVNAAALMAGKWRVVEMLGERHQAVIEPSVDASARPEDRSASIKRFDVVVSWDAEAGVWWGTNDVLPMTTEAPTLAEFEARAKEIGQEMAEINGLAAPGERVEIRVVREPEQSTP